MTGNRVLLTGGAGFVARPTRTRLESLGLEVITVDRRGDVDFVGDLAEPGFAASMPDVDIVVHTAAVQYVSRDLPLLGRERFFARNNVTATANLVDRYRGAIDHFINFGTSMMYAEDAPSPLSPSSPFGGVGVYSRSKLAAYKRLATLDAPTATLIPCIIGGHGREGLFRGFVEMMTKRGVAVCPGPGNRLTHMVHVDDVALLVERIVVDQLTGLINAGGAQPLTVNQWIDVIADELSLDPARTIHVPYGVVSAAAKGSRYRLIAREQWLMLGHDHVLDTSASEAAGWQPQWSNEQIVRDIARYIAEAPAPDGATIASGRL